MGGGLLVINKIVHLADVPPFPSPHRCLEDRLSVVEYSKIKDSHHPLHPVSYTHLSQAATPTQKAASS